MALDGSILQFVQGASNFFSLSPDLLVFPNVIGSVIVPIILNTLMIRILLGKMRLPGPIAWLVAAVSAYFTLPWGAVLMYASAIVIGATRSWRTSFKVAFIVAVGALLFFGLPLLYGFVSRGTFYLAY